MRLARRAGYTLTEVIVVLVLLAIATAVVAPSLVSSGSEASSELIRVIGRAREAAVRRGETVHLRIDRSGAWQVVAGAPPGGEILTSGQLTDAPADRVELVFSPLGTCGPPAEAAPVTAFDPLTCETVSP